MRGGLKRKRGLEERGNVKTRKGMLTATNVPGKKNIPSTDMVFIAALSLCVSTAILRMTAESSLEDPARRIWASAMSRDYCNISIRFGWMPGEQTGRETKGGVEGFDLTTLLAENVQDEKGNCTYGVNAFLSHELVNL